MSLDRRTFLELVAGWLGATAFSSSSPRAIQDDYFVATDLELAMQKPSGWIFIPPETVAREAADIGKTASINTMIPSVMNISKHAWASNPKRFCPGISIWTKPSTLFDGPAQCCSSFAGSQSFYRDYRLIRKPQPIRLQDGDAWHCDFSCTFETVGLDRPTPIRCRAVAIEQPSHFVQLLLCDAPEIGFDESLALERFLSSLRHIPRTADPT